MKWVADRTGRFPQRPHYEMDEIDRECEQIVKAFLRKQRGRVSCPISTEELKILVEQEAGDLDLYAELDAGVEGVTDFYQGHKPGVRIARELAEDERRENRLRTTLMHELWHVKFHNFLYFFEQTPVLAGWYIRARIELCRDGTRCRQATPVLDDCGGAARLISRQDASTVRSDSPSPTKGVAHARSPRPARYRRRARRPARAAPMPGGRHATGRPRSGRRGARRSAPQHDELLAEHALLRHQLVVLRRSVQRPRCTPADRAGLVLLASRVRTWRTALLIVQPETLLRWHRRLFRRHWRRKSRAAASASRAKVPAETIALIREMAAVNALWGAERIRGELLKLDIRVAKWTVQKYMRDARPPRRAGQTWATFLRNHADTSWACDFLPITDVFFRPVYAFFVVALGSRRVVHVGVTRHPTDAWVAQQLREATPFEQRPTYLIRDNDRKYGRAFTRVAEASGITVLRTAYRAPRQNAACERFLGSVRRECLDHVLVLGEGYLRRILREYADFFNGARPHQGLQQRIPDGTAGPVGRPATGGPIRVVPVLGGLHHTYYRAA